MMLAITRWGPRILGPALLVSASVLHAQWQSNTGPSGVALGAVVGGDVERYMRALSIAGVIRQLPWGARPFSPDDLERVLTDSNVRAHPWRVAIADATKRRATLGLGGGVSVNSGFPWGANDGAQWQGRGLNGALGGVATFRLGRVSAVAAPTAFYAQNASFPQLRQRATTVSEYADPLFPGNVDLPQRMGANDYARLDAGESSIRISVGAASFGISSASAGWGTGESFPAILGANAGGFPHAEVGTRATGVRVPVLGLVSARYLLGVLQQSPWSPVQGSATYINAQQSGTRRIGTGVTVSLTPMLFKHLEIGASRFYHSPYRNGSSRWSAWSKPFEGLFKRGFENRNPGTDDPSGDADNQLAAFFARWVLPARGVEANFELLREDHNWDSRDLAQEPENNSAVMASLRAVTHRDASRLAVLTLEYFDGEVRPIAQARAQGYLYISGGLLQGHTQRGQLLGAPLGAGAVSGARATWEQFRPTGSLRVNLQRWRTRAVRTQDFQGLFPAAEARIANDHDWIVDASALLSRYRGRGARSVEAGLAWAGVWNFDRSRANVYARASWNAF
jgi:hypothetical protein